MSRRMLHLALALVVVATLPACPLNQCFTADIACAPNFFLPFTLPETGATDVPLNARIWFSAQADFSGGDPVVTTGGTKVPGAIRQLTTTFGGSSIQVFVPKDPLNPNSTYVVTAAEIEVTRFTTGTRTLSGTLSPPKTTVIDRHIPQGQCDSASGTVALDPAGVLNLVVIAGQEAQFDETRGDGAVMLISQTSPVTLSANGCGNWDGKAKVRFGTLDIAGRFSGWGEIL